GVFAESLKFVRLPAGSYTLELVADGTTIRQTWFEVGEIVKPAYTLEVEVDRHVFVAGEEVVATVTARFFDGTPVPGLPIWLSTERQTDVDAQWGVTDADGRMTRSIRVEAGDYQIVATPRAAEEADIEGRAEIEVFPSSVDVRVRGIVDGSRVRFEGFVYRVDVEALERTWDRRWSEEWWALTGPPVPSAVASITVVDRFWVAIPTGRRYDFISKQSVETFRWEYRSPTILERSVTTDRQGQFEVDLPRTEPEREYQANVTTADGDGRLASGWGSASTWPNESEARRPVTGTRSYLVERSDDCGGRSSTVAAVGDVVPITMYDASGTAIEDGANRYLFATTARGLQDVSVTASPTHVQPFRPGDLPNLFVDAVRFTGDAYVQAVGYRVGIDRGRHSLSVTLTAASGRYRPGDTVNVQVRTTTAEGTPVPASVVLRAVDEKLFASGHAWVQDVPRELLTGVRSGLQEIVLSHEHPLPDMDCGGGDTTGGGGDERFDFRDTALFEKIQTDRRGRASVSFTLPHDLTSWRVLATAIDEGLRVGDSRLLVPVGLPFFAEMTVGASYVSGDRPAVRVRAYGAALDAGDSVRFEVSSDLPGQEPTVVIGTAFAPYDVALPAMPVGRHRITVRATSTVDGVRMTDALTRSIDVVATRLTRTESVAWAVGAAIPDLSRANGLVEVTVHDTGRARLLPWLWAATPADGLRLDSLVAADTARQLLIDRFGVDAARLPEALWQGADYDREENGWALVPHGSPDLRLTTRVAIAAPDLARQTTGYLRGLADNPDERRDRRLRAIAALAALGDNVLPDIVAAAQATDLSTDERLLLALGAGLAGDDAIATGQLGLVLEASGEQFGPWIRVRATDPDASLRSTALLAMALASVGDPRALDALAYLEVVRSTRELFALEPVIVARLLVDRLPASTGRARWTIDGQWSEVSGGTWLTLSPEQAATLRLERLDGTMEAVARFQVSDPVVAPSAGGRLVRSSFANALPDDQLVTVSLSFTPPPSDAAETAYVITEQVPSGLAPMQLSGMDSDAAWYTIDGQTVRWWVDPGEANRRPLRYRARVVTTGSYVWEPAVARGSVSGRVVAATGENRVTVQSRT
ncbi:MAG TPA: alpha-2-macroglobulin family protein, partial [Candidatus Limnocylindrales bacterium]|nr:alpha-2-macroglobulin family protein [Candidatus Limnocylindrales bacterium]